MATAKKTTAKRVTRRKAAPAKKAKATGAKRKTTIKVEKTTPTSAEAAAPSVEALLGMVLEAARGGAIGEQLQTVAKSLVETPAKQPVKSKPPKRKAAATKDLKVTTLKNTKLSKVKLNWKEVWYTNCPMVSASNIDQELGWAREEFKKIGVKYAFMRSTPDNDWYPHYVHNLDNLIRFGGMFPPIAVHADIRRTRLLGLTWVYEGGCMLVRSRDDIYTMADLKGKKIGLSKSLNMIKNDWWRIQEHQGIELMLRINGMTMDDVEIVEFPYEDNWYNDPSMVGPPIENPSELWLQRDHKHDLAFRPLETALEKGLVDAIYTQSKPFQHLQEETGKFKAIEDLSRYPDWTMQMCNQPTTATCTVEMAEKHPELVVTWLKAMIKVGRWGNEHKHAAASILDKQTFYLDVEDTYRGIKDVDLAPNLSVKNLRGVEVGKDFMLSHGYIKNDFDVQKWAAPEFLDQAARELLEEEWQKRTSAKLPKAAKSLASGGRLG